MVESSFRRMAREAEANQAVREVPWRKDVDPHEIPNGYCETKHKGLASTIAKPGDIRGAFAASLPVMACHETHDAHCIGWLVHQLGAGNNIGLRLQMLDCENAGKIKTVGEQHERFDDTLPR